ncbi:MAG: sugar ABC transporter substrate-binding protein [Eubacterium sp.]|nr:sugar ABC transporter substrate-binding protein [Eubacterium sp.]
MKSWLKKGMTVVICGALALGLAACGSTGGGSNEPEDGSGGGGGSKDGAGKTEMTFQIWDTGQKAGMEALVDAYVAEHQNVSIEVQVTNWGEYFTKLEAAATSNTMPDIFWMHTNEIFKYADNGMLADCTDIVETEHYSDISLQNCKGSDGKLYGVPKDKDFVALTYSKKIFDEAGVEYPNEDWTWDDLISASEQIYEKTGKYGYLAYLDDQIGYWNFIYQAGGYILNEDGTQAGYTQPGTNKAMKFFVGVQDNDWCPKQDTFAETSPQDLFFSERAAMLLQGNYMFLGECNDNPNMNGEWDVAVLPKCPDPVSGDGRATISNGLCYATSAKGKNKEAAMEFIKWLGTEEAQRIQGESGAAIPAYVGLEDTWLSTFEKNGYKLSLEPLMDMFDYSVQSPNNASRPQWKTPVADELLKVYSGDQDIDTALQNMQNIVDEAIAKGN